MSTRDSFTVYLYGLSAREIKFRIFDDGRHWLDITSDIALSVRPETDDVAAVTAGLRKLAEAAGEMAEALSRLGGEPEREQDAPEGGGTWIELPRSR